MEALLGKSSINGPFSMVMLNNQMVNLKKYQNIPVHDSSWSIDVHCSNKTILKIHGCSHELISKTI